MKGKGNKEKWAGEIYTGGKNTCRHAHKGSGTYTYKYTHMHSVMLPAGVLKGNHSFIPLLLFWVCVLHSVYLIREPGRVWLSAWGHATQTQHIFIFLSTQITQHLVHTNDKSTLSHSTACTHTDTHRLTKHNHTPTTHILITRSPMSIWALKDCGWAERGRGHRERKWERGKSNGVMHSGSYSCWFPRWEHRLIYLNNTFQTGQRGHRGWAGWVCVWAWMIACDCLCVL